MRIAVLPTMTLNSLGDSEFAGFVERVQALQELRDDLYAYMIVPRGVQRLIDDAGLRPEKIEFVFEDEAMTFYTAHGETPASFLRLFNPLIGKYPIDVMYTSRSCVAGVLNRMLWDYRFRHPLPIVIEESMAVDHGIKSQTVNDCELVARTLSYAVGWPVFHSDYEHGIAMSAAKRFLRPSIVDVLMRKSVVVERVLDCDRIDNVICDVKKNEQFTLFVGQRLNETKGAETLLKIYDQFYAAGRDVRILATSPRAESFTLERWRQGRAKKKGAHSKATVFPEVEFVQNCSQKDFWRHCAAAHVYLNMSEAEGFPLGFIEQLYCGPVAIFSDEPWVKGLLGEDVLKEYPYVFRTGDQAAMLLRRVHDDYKLASKWSDWLKEVVRKKFGQKKEITRKLLNVFEVANESLESKLTSGGKELTDATLADLNEPLGIDSVYSEICKRSMWMKEGHTRGGQVSKWMVYKYLLSLGYRDLCDGPEARFVKCR